jgi:hypothetical protein
LFELNSTQAKSAPNRLRKNSMIGKYTNTIGKVKRAKSGTWIAMIKNSVITKGIVITKLRIPDLIKKSNMFK